MGFQQSSTIENGFTTIFSRANVKDYQEKKINLELQKIIHNAMH